MAASRIHASKHKKPTIAKGAGEPSKPSAPVRAAFSRLRGKVPTMDIFTGELDSNELQPLRGSSITRARAILTAFQTVDPLMPMQVANTFLLVAQFPERAAREYISMTNIPQTTMSRHLLTLGEFARNKAPGYGLIEQMQSRDDLRRNVYRLTPKGKSLCHNIQAIIET